MKTYAIKGEEKILVTSENRDRLVGYRFIQEEESEVERKIQAVHDEFDQKINEFLSKYPKREQDTFAEKRAEADKVLAGGSSVYIEGKAEALGITPKQFAQKIVDKNDELTALYLEWENQKDAKVQKILELNTSEGQEK